MLCQDTKIKLANTVCNIRVAGKIFVLCIYSRLLANLSLLIMDNENLNGRDKGVVARSYLLVKELS